MMTDEEFENAMDVVRDSMYADDRQTRYDLDAAFVERDRIIADRAALKAENERLLALLKASGATIKLMLAEWERMER